MDIQLPDLTVSIESDVAVDFMPETLIDDSQLVGENLTDDALEASTLLALVTVEDATHLAIARGSWFDANTWQNGEVPGQDARVIIPDGVAVSYDDVSDTRLQSLRIDGELNFATDIDTKMVVDTLVVSPLGTLNIGSENSPVQSDVSAQIVVADNGPINTLLDPNQLGRGVVSLGAVNIHGYPKTSFLSAEIAPAAGDSNIMLETVPEDWQVGDTLAIAAPQEVDEPLTGTEESVTIAAISGNRVTLDRPLQFDHEAHGTADTYVANVSRNVVIETENADKLPFNQRGHVLLAGSDLIDVRYAEFHELGRTNHLKPLDSPLLDQGDRTNIPGRYALHLSQVGNPATDAPATLVGNSIVGSPGYGIVQANSHTRLDNNAVYDVIGAGFVAATDQESGDWLNNIAIKAVVADRDPLASEFASKVAADFEAQGTITSQGNISTELGPLAATTIAASDSPEAIATEVVADDGLPIIEPLLANAAAQPMVMSLNSASAAVKVLDSRKAEMWEFEEWDLQNPTYDGNPFDLDASVIFTHTQTGEQRTTQMFYDGGDEWSFRFTGDLAGTWRFITDSRDQDLDGFKGTVNVLPNDNPEVEGFLTSVGNKFAIQTEDANTLDGYLLNVYMNQRDHFNQDALEQWTPAKTDAYLAEARENGTEVLYFMVSNSWFDFGSLSNREHDSRNPDERTFELLEDIITDVHQQGGRVHFWAWGDEERGWTPIDGINSEADQRLQSYIAARLSPLPGWSMGYSFDTQEFTDDSEMDFWASNLQNQMGWDHLLFSRGYAASPKVQVNNASQKNDWVATELSGNSYSSKGRFQAGLQTAPVSPENIEEVIQDINSDTDNPHFYEERFSYNRSSVGSTQGGPNDMDQTRRLMWWQAMAGGVGGWIGFFNKSGNQGPPYSNPEQLKTHYTFWHENDRFTLDLRQANHLADSSDTHLLKSADDRRYIVYTEDRDAVQVDLPKLPANSRAIAVDTQRGYQEVDLGRIAAGKNRAIDLPYASDWAIVIEADAASSAPTPLPQPPSIPPVVAPPAPPAPTAPPDDSDGLLLRWAMDDGEGQTAQDASGQGRDGTLQGGASWADVGQIDGALQLNGKGQVVLDADAETYLNGLDAITLAMWVKSDQVGTDRGFLTTVKPNGNDKNLGLRYDDKGANGGGNDVIKVGLRTTQGVVEYESAANVQTQEWQHIVLSWRSGEAPKLYINGQMDKPTVTVPAIGGTLSGITDLIVGQGQRIPAAWDGGIDDVRIYDRALATAEVNELYDSSDVPNPSPIGTAPPDLADDEPPLGSHLERQLRSKDLGALQEIYNVTFNEREKPDVHIGMAASDVIMLKVQQNEFIGEAREYSDLVKEPFDLNLNQNNIEIIGPNGKAFQPTAVHRKSKVADAAKRHSNFIIDHYFHLELPKDLDADAEYTVRFKNGNLDTINFTPEDNVSLAIHHPRVYDAKATNKFAKLSSWMSKQGGGVDYEAGTPFQVINEATGQVVHSGGIKLDAADDKVAGTDVYSLDLSAVQQPGTYRIAVAGIGKSLPFEVRQHVWEDMLDLSMEGLYVHRAFAELEQPYTDFVRPGNSDIKFYASSASEADVEVFGAGDRRKLLTQNVDRSQTIKLQGGWFDAGDYDTRSIHLGTVATLVDLYSTNPGYFQRFNPNIPESGDGIPDILNEAMWGLQLYKQLQQPDGGVSAGYEFDSHPAGTRSWEEQEAFIWAPDFRSSYRFATAAAKMSTAIAAYDPQEANDLKQRAIQAFDWAEQDFAAQSRPFKGSGKANEYRQYRQLAAVEVYRLTGQDKYHDVFRSIKETRNYDASFTYAQLDPNIYTAVDVEWQEQLRNGVIQNGDNLVRFGKRSGFDTVNNPAFDQNWGFNTVITNKHAHYLAMAHQLTGDDQYVDTLAQSMPFGMGMNPDNLSFTTGTKDRGLAYDEVEAILHDDGRAMDQVPDGITAYGFYSRNWFAWPAINKATNNTFFNKQTWSLDVPLIEAFNDYHLLVPSTEYTIHQTIDDQIFANGYLASQVANRPSAARRSADALTGMPLSMQVAGTPDVNDPLTNYAASSDTAMDVAAEPSAGSHFLTLESATATTQDVDAIALSPIGNTALNESEDSPLGDGLAAVTGTSPLEVDPNPPAAVV